MCRAKQVWFANTQYGYSFIIFVYGWIHLKLIILTNAIFINFDKIYINTISIELKSKSIYKWRRKSLIIFQPIYVPRLGTGLPYAMPYGTRRCAKLRFRDFTYLQRIFIHHWQSGFFTFTFAIKVVIKS